jgi:hypothetical protein
MSVKSGVIVVGVVGVEGVMGVVLVVDEMGASL